MAQASTSRLKRLLVPRRSCSSGTGAQNSMADRFATIHGGQCGRSRVAKRFAYVCTLTVIVLYRLLAGEFAMAEPQFILSWGSSAVGPSGFTRPVSVASNSVGEVYVG